MNSDNVYCRLCAELKHVQKLVDLQSDSATCRDLIDKLMRLDSPIEFIDTKLPSTVCYDCIRALDKCFRFVVGIECAQTTLAEIIAQQQDVKMEYEDVEAPFGTDDFSEGDVPDTFEAKHIKTEEAQDQADDVKASGKIKRVSLDSIPLSELKEKESWAGFYWLCTRCKTQFQNVGDLRTHSIAVHNLCNPWRCSIRNCKIRKQNLEQFIIHVQKHNRLLKRSCYECFKSFNTVAKSHKHRNIHINSDFCCPGCHTTFENNDELKTHTEMFYNGLVSSEAKSIPPTAMSGKTCLLCSKSFKNSTNVRIHIMRIHSERRAEHICDVCGRAFYDKHNRAQHMLHVHTDYRPHKCHICKLGFKTPKSLKDHIGRHFNEKPLACDKCGKRFRLKKHLTKHSVIHTDALPFQCHFCEKRFQRKQYLTNHLLQHTGERPYSCEACQQRFTSWGNYNKHMVCRHNQDMARKKPVLVENCVDEL